MQNNLKNSDTNEYIIQNHIILLLSIKRKMIICKNLKIINHTTKKVISTIIIDRLG